MRREMSLFLAVLMLTGVSGCSVDEIPATSIENTATVTLNVETSYGGDDGNRKIFQTALDSFQDETGIQVADFSSVSNEDWKSEVLTDFITGSEPDVLFYFTNADAEPFVDAGKVVSIEEIREEYPDYAGNMRDELFAQAADGQHYAVPGTGYWETLFVNKRVLNACNIPIPGPDYTWEQFLEDCKIIRDKNFTPLACSLFEIPHYWFEFMVMNHGNSENHQDLPSIDENGKLIDNSAARKWTDALADIKMLYNEGFFPENTLTVSDTQTVAMFAEGEAAFLIDGSWKVGFLADNYPQYMEDYVVSFVPAQGERKASDVIGGISMGYFITRKAWNNLRKRDAAVKFVSYMTSDEILSTFVTTEMTALKMEANPLGMNMIQRSAAEARRYVTGFAPAVQDSLSSEAKSDLFSNIPKVVKGTMAPAQAVESAMKRN